MAWPSGASSDVRTGRLVFCFDRDAIAAQLMTEVRRRRRARRLFDREANAQAAREVDEHVEQGIEDGRDQQGQHQREHLAADDHLGHAGPAPAPGPLPRAIGTMAATSITVVIRIGRSRVWLASMIASCRDSPLARSWLVAST